MATPDIGQRVPCAQCMGCGVDLFRIRATGRAPKVCVTCRPRYAIIKARSKGAVPFAVAHRRRTEASLAKRTSACQACGVTFVAKTADRLKFCSRQCAGVSKRTRPPPSSRVYFNPCGVCERTFVSRTSRGRWCSEQCRKSGSALESLNWYRRSRGNPHCPHCPDCGVAVANDGSYQRRCEPCRRDHANKTARISRSARRSRIRSATVERVDPFTVFERDGWRCQCCRKSSPRERRGTYHPRAPELDHIIPLSRGGEHSYRNTQLLCRACNGAKSDNDEGQQMRLFG